VQWRFLDRLRAATYQQLHGTGPVLLQLLIDRTMRRFLVDCHLEAETLCMVAWRSLRCLDQLCGTVAHIYLLWWSKRNDGVRVHLRGGQWRSPGKYKVQSNLVISPHFVRSIFLARGEVGGITWDYTVGMPVLNTRHVHSYCTCFKNRNLQ